MKRSIPHIVWDGGAVAIIGAALTALIFAGTTQAGTAQGWRAAAIGFFYAAAAVISFRVTSRLIRAKLEIFPAVQQWILKAALYTIGLSVAYLLGIVFHTVVLIPADVLLSILFDQFWNGFVHLITLPFAQNEPGRWLDLRMRSLAITFFTVLFLIGLVSLVFSLIEMRWREARRQRALEQAELTALRAQMEPHFLFNSLNVIASLIKTDPDRAEALLVQLSQLLRHIFQHSGAMSTRLGDELDFTRRYVDLLQARYGEKIQLEWRIEPGWEETKAPGLLLQPLIENAVRHGRGGSDKPLRIDIALSSSGSELMLSVADNGSGIGPDKLSLLPQTGHALANIAERLNLEYRRSDLLAIASTVGRGTTVSIRLPVQ